MTTNQMSIRDRLLSEVGKRRFGKVEIPGIGEVEFQSLTELEACEVSEASVKDRKRYRAILIQRTVVNDKGMLVFGKGDLDTILSMDVGITERLVDAIETHLKQRPTTEDHEKNSESTQDGYTSVT